MALKFSTHVDTVLFYRQEFLKATKRPETLRAFLQYAGQVAIDVQAIRLKIEADKEAERQRPGATPYQ